jgi:hypothetical protein
MRARLAALVLAMTSFGSQAQNSSGTTTIDLTFDSVDTRLRPCCSSNNYGHHELHVVLSKTDGFSTSQKNQSGKYISEGSNNFVLGHAVRGEFATVVWHVLGANRLMSTTDFPQNTRTMIVDVLPDKTCKFQVIDKLKPGFKEYSMSSISLHTMAYYFPVEITGTTCAIH